MSQNEYPAERLPGNPRYLIRGVEYPMVSLDSADLWACIDMQEQAGLIPADMERLLVEIASVGQPGAKFATDQEVYRSPDHLRALAVQMWLARRAAGEDLTIREASSVPLTEWSIVVDEAQEPEAEADPTDGQAESAPDSGTPTS